MSIKLAGCVILDGHERMYLLHRNKKGVTQWELPGGKIEAGEAEDDAAKREIQEELGVDVRIVRKLGDTEFVENDLQFEYVWFLAEIQSGELRICEPESFEDLKSFAMDELKDLKLSGNMKKFFAAYSAGAITL